MIEIGDKVRITDPDQCYQEEVDWVYEYVSDKKLAIGYDILGRPNDDDTGTVIAMWNTGIGNEKAYYVQVDGCDGPSPYCYVMNEAGVEIIGKKIKAGDVVILENAFPSTYDLYAIWVAKNVDDKEMIARYAFGSSLRPGRDEKFRVITVAEHGSSPKTLAYIKRLTLKKECYLVGIENLKKVEDVG